MGSDRQEVARRIRQMLSDHLDPDLGNDLFRRRANSLIYTRLLPDGRQRIQFWFSVRPSIAPDAIHIDPTVDILFPEVNEFLSRELGVLLPRADSFTQRVHLQVLAPKGNRLWLAKSESDFESLGIFFRQFLNELVLPRLNEIVSVESFVGSASKRGYERYGFDVECFVYVAAAQVLLGQPDKALATLLAHYDPMFPKEYTPAVDYVRSMAAQG